MTQTLGRLKRLGLARQVRYGAIGLTPEGRELAVKVLRRHALLEHLLVGVLQYPWEKADEEAKRLQSQISEDLTEHLFLRFGSPQTCPHGNPLPGSPLEARLLKAPRLTHWARPLPETPEWVTQTLRLHVFARVRRPSPAPWHVVPPERPRAAAAPRS